MKRKLTKHEKEVLFSDFPDAGKEIEYDRETIMRHSPDIRDVRLATGRFVTPREQRERAKKIFGLKDKDI